MKRTEYKSIMVPVWIRATGLPLQPAMLEGASNHSGEVHVSCVYDIPDDFELLFSPIAQTWRECKALWRKPDGTMGVYFVARRMRGDELRSAHNAPIRLPDPRSVASVLDLV